MTAGVAWRDAALPVGLAGAAAVAMVAWGVSPGARYMQHGSTVGTSVGTGTGSGTHLHHLGHHPGALPSGPAVVAGLTATWLLMTVATMLPTATPLLAAVRQVAAGRSPRQAAVGVIGGFLAVWTVFGLMVATADLQLQRVVNPTAAPWVLAGTLALAGGYQLSGMAARCLRACRHPFGFLGRHWTGRPDVGRQGLAIGLAYGRSCLGCCAALMVVMFALGLGNPAWMLVFAAIGAVQKQASWGESLTRPVGIGMLVAAATLMTTQAVA